MTSAGRPPEREGLSIGAVLAQLRTDFPDVTISKIRFLESEGLVRPARTASGYRQFTSANVDRLRFVLAAQRDHYLPLKVIKEQLDAMDRGLDSQPSGVAASGRVAGADRDTNVVRGWPEQRRPTSRDFASGAETRMTREELLAEVGIDAATLAELEQYGLVRPGAAGFYDPDAAQVARTVRAMTEYGIEPRHLRAFRASADREIGLLEQILSPLDRHRDPDARSRADEVARELAALSVNLHMLLVKVGLRAVRGG